MLRERLLVSFVLIPIVLAAVYLGGWALLVVWGIAFLLCGYEFFAILRAGGYRSNLLLGLVLIAILLAAAQSQIDALPYVLIVLVILPPFLELFRKDHAAFLTSWALTSLGVLYVGGLGAYLFRLWDLNSAAARLVIPLTRGAAWLLITLLATWATDTAAYIVGKSMGRRPFFHEISPKKTWEGAIGGIAGATIAFGILASYMGVSPFFAFPGGLIIGVAGTVGDLAESLIKRQVGVKDSGALLVGHGGVLDRLDSTLFTVVAAYYFFVLVGK